MVGVGAAMSVLLVSVIGLNDEDAGTLLELLSPPGAGYDSTNGDVYTGAGGVVTFTRASTATCQDSNGSIRSLASGKPCVVDGASLRVRSAVTNLHSFSEQFDNAAWGKTFTTVTANQRSAPDGTTTADLVRDDSTAGTELSQSISVAAGATVTHSRYVYRGDHDIVRLTISNADDTSLVRGWFNVATGAALSTAVAGTGSGAVARVEALGSTGWYRLSLTGALGGETAYRVLSTSASADGSTTRVNLGTRYEWGAQTVTGSQPGDYCPTGASSATCAAETATTELSPAPAASPWCVRVRVTKAATDAWTGYPTSRFLWNNDVGGNGSAVFRLSGSGVPTVEIYDSANNALGWTAPALTANSHRLRACYSGSAVTIDVDGTRTSGAGVGAGTGVLPGLATTHYIGSNSSGAQQPGVNLDSFCFSSSLSGCP